MSINTVPVANKEMCKINSSVKKDFGVIPIPVGENESFFDVVEVTDEYGNVYNRSSGYKDEKKDLCYT